MFQVTIRMIFDTDSKDDAVRLLLADIGRTRAKPGCIHCSVWNDADNMQLVVYEELWRNEEALALHQKSFAFRSVRAVMKMANAPPEIQLHVITSTSGMELIEKARIKDGQ